MTDRVSTLTVILEQDMRDDDAPELAKTIAQVRGVSEVKLGPVVDFDNDITRSRLLTTIARDVYNTIAGEKILR